MNRCVKTILVIFGSILGAAACAICLWALLYLVNPICKDKTNKLFKWGDYKEEVIEKSEAETITPKAYIFSNDFVDIRVG